MKGQPLVDDPAAEAQFATCTEMLRRDLDATPGPVVHEAMRETRHGTVPPMSDIASIDAIVEAGAAAVSAGAVEAGVLSLRNAVRLADAPGAPGLRVRSRLVLAEALVHSVGGLDEDGLANLHEADEIALAEGDNKSMAHRRWSPRHRPISARSPAITARPACGQPKPTKAPSAPFIVART